MDTVYVTDGSLEGLLSAVYASWYNREDNVFNILPALPAQPDLLLNYQAVATDEAKAEKVFDAIVEKIGSEAAHKVMLCWFSNEPDAGRVILDYLRLGFRAGPLVEEMVTHRHVKPLHDMSRRVGFEAHRLTGLLRFQETAQGSYYAVIEPLYYILPMLAEHFADRMADVRWLIHDKGRALSAIYADGQWAIVSGHLSDTVQQSGNEDRFQEMWRRYFDTMAIENRLNLKLQQRFIPKRYWKHLVERPGRR